MLDFPTKLAKIVAKTDSQSLVFVVESLFVDMTRKNAAGPYGTVELGKVINVIVWVRAYLRATAAKHNELFKKPHGFTPSDAGDVGPASRIFLEDGGPR